MSISCGWNERGHVQFLKWFIMQHSRCIFQCEYCSWVCLLFLNLIASTLQTPQNDVRRNFGGWCQLVDGFNYTGRCKKQYVVGFYVFGKLNYIFSNYAKITTHFCLGTVWLDYNWNNWYKINIHIPNLYLF